jgi:hypothetical protein
MLNVATRKDAAVTGPGHYQQAEKLLAKAVRMMDTDVGPEASAEHLLRQAVTVMQGAAHAVLSLAAATGLAGGLDALDSRAWRDVAGTKAASSSPPAGFDPHTA